jgi:hypothetical protein
LSWKGDGESPLSARQVEEDKYHSAENTKQKPIDINILKLPINWQHDD